MHAEICDLVRYVEPGTLPRRQRLYAQRREFAALPAAKAFVVGLGMGSTATIAAALLLALLSGCATLVRPHKTPWSEKAAIKAKAADMQDAVKDIVFQPTKKLP